MVYSIEVQTQEQIKYIPPNNYGFISTASMSISRSSIIADMRKPAFLDIYSLREKTDFDRLKEIYTLRYPERVYAFLQEHPFLANLLLEAYTNIEKHFGKNIRVKLKVSRDPEAEDEYEQLFAYIKTDLPVMEAINRLSQLDHDWYLKQPSSVRRIFNLNV